MAPSESVEVEASHLTTILAERERSPTLPFLWPFSKYNVGGLKGNVLPSSIPVGSQVQVELRLALHLEITTHPWGSREPAWNRLYMVGR